MNRKTFLRNSVLGFCFTPFLKIHAMLNLAVTPLEFYFKDDGVIPNSKYPLLVYKNAFSERGDAGANWLEKQFASNHWSNSWRWRIFPYHHYHSITHEVLGVFQGSAEVHMGGEKGQKMTIEAGDIIVIPAGVGHKCLLYSPDFTVVGAYPNGMDWDILKGKKGERPQADQNIANVPVPDTDPLQGKAEGTGKIWRAVK